MSLLNTSIIHEAQPGIYYTNIRQYKEVNPKGDRQPYILVEMIVDGVIVTDRWYASRIPYIMYQLRKQFHMDYMDCTLSQILEYSRTHVIRVSLDYDVRYGRQIDYSAN